MSDDTPILKSLSDYILILVRWRRIIILNVLVVAVLTAGLAMVVPQWYTSTASVMPTEQSGLDSGLLSFVQATLPLFQAPGTTSPSQSLLAILESRRVAEGVIRKNGLLDAYKARTMDEAVLTLRGRASAIVNENGVVIVRAEAKNPVLARDVVATYIDELEQYNSEVRSTAGRRVREFVEGRLEETRARLTQAEQHLVSFQKEHVSIEISEQARAMIGSLSDLDARISMTEIQLGLVRGYASADHPEVTRLESELREYRRRLDALRSDESPGASGTSIPLAAMPELAIELVRLTRETEMLNQVYLYLIQEYEIARIEEARDTPTVQTLDTPTVAEIRTRPRRTVMVILGGIVGLLVGVVAALVLEFYRITDESNRTRRNLDTISGMLRDDLARLSGRRRGPPG